MMKRNMIYKVLGGAFSSLLLLGSSFLTACSDYLDVAPSDQQTADQLFATPTGFYVAANGIYDKLSGDDLYGKYMTWGGVDLMSQSYNTANLSLLYSELGNNAYTGTYAAHVLSATWGTAYESILAANLLIERIDQQSGILSKQEADCLKGEMLAVRAFLHLDMLRLFGPSPVFGLDQKAIPYNESTNITTLDLLSIAEVGEKVIGDLNEAEELLKSDPIIENGPMMSEAAIGESVQNRYRQYRLNYYAVIALKARAYLWVGNKEKALAEAMRLINDNKVQTMFPPVDPNQLLANSYNPDRVFSSEVFFGVYDKDRDQVYDRFFASSAPATQRLQPYAGYIGGSYGLFGHLLLGVETNDYRYQSQWELASGLGATGHSFIKYKAINKPDQQDENSEYYYAKMIPLVTMQEMYYIACECEENPVDKAGWYNKARVRRGCIDLEMMGLLPTLAAYWAQGYGDIFLSNEYRREFYGTGQWFFMAKRVEILAALGMPGVGMSYYFDCGLGQSVVQFDVRPPLPAGEMR